MFCDAERYVTFMFVKLYALELLRFVTLHHVTFALCCFTLCSNILLRAVDGNWFNPLLALIYSTVAPPPAKRKKTMREWREVGIVPVLVDRGDGGWANSNDSKKPDLIFYNVIPWKNILLIVTCVFYSFFKYIYLTMSGLLMYKLLTFNVQVSLET